MFSNTIEYALESAIVSFNEYLQKRENYISYSDADLKNAFIQRYKLAMKSLVADSFHCHFQPSNLEVFEIKNNALINLKFTKIARWNSIGEEKVDVLNSVISKLNLINLAENKVHCATLGEFCDSKIQSINNYKI